MSINEQEDSSDLFPTTQTVTEIKATLSEQFQQKVADQYARNIEKFAPMDSYIIRVGDEDLSFKRRSILTKERKDLESIRMTYAWEVRRMAKTSVETEDKLYKKCAAYHLIDARTNKPMSEEQYENTVFEEIKPILDACTYRTEKPIPPLEG